MVTIATFKTSIFMHHFCYLLTKIYCQMNNSYHVSYESIYLWPLLMKLFISPISVYTELGYKSFVIICRWYFEIINVVISCLMSLHINTSIMHSTPNVCQGLHLLEIRDLSLFQFFNFLHCFRILYSFCIYGNKIATELLKLPFYFT
jgi:hypothetical protein